MRFLVTLSAASLAVVVPACCAVALKPVKMLGQSNLVYYDAANKIEHFVRQASFDTEGEALGFIAPTPTQPRLGEVDSAVFERCSKIINAFADREFRKGMSRGGSAGGGNSAPPKVISVERVAGYEATILQASDANGLKKWLDANNFKTADDTEAWLSTYIKKNWYFTAFKVAKGKDGSFKTGLVRMSFFTDTPYVPYSVPESNRTTKPGGLTVFFLTSAKNLLPSEETLKPGITAPVSSREAEFIARELRINIRSMTKDLTLTHYQDPLFPRYKTRDIYFESYTSFFENPVVASPKVALIPADNWLLTATARNLSTASRVQ